MSTIPYGTLVECIRNQGGDVEVGDIGVVVGTYMGNYKVRYPRMNDMCTQRGYWIGGRHTIRPIERHEEELYY